MTFAYRCYFTLVWLPAILAVPAALTLAIWGITQYQSVPRLWIGLGVAAVLAVVAAFMRTHGPRVMIRAGAWPALCIGDYTPTTEAALRAAVKTVFEKTGKPPTIVGSGWGFFLYRYGAVGPRIFTHRYTGRQENDRLRWKSGTTIMSLTRTLLKERDQVLETYPTMDYITLGGWFGPGCHGNGGPASGKSSDCMLNARVLDMTADRIVGNKPIGYKELRKLFDGSDSYRYCILDVAIGVTKQNSDVQKKGIVIDSQETAAEWLDPRAYLRVIFMGAAREYGIGLQWLPIYDTEAHGHRDPHCCSRYCQYTQVDNCSVVCGWHEPMSKFNGVVSRFHANQWIPPILPLEVLFVTFAGYRNFEIFFKLPAGDLDDRRLWSLMQSVIKMHKRIGGRSELRNGNAKGLVCLDMALTGRFNAPFEMLYNEFNVDRVSLHLGKWHDLPTTPCQRVPLSGWD